MCELGTNPLIAELDQAQILLLKAQIGETRGEALDREHDEHAILKRHEFHLFQIGLLQTQSTSTLQVETAKREKEMLEQKMKDRLSEIHVEQKTVPGCPTPNPNIFHF